MTKILPNHWLNSNVPWTYIKSIIPSGLTTAFLHSLAAHPLDHITHYNYTLWSCVDQLAPSKSKTVNFKYSALVHPWTSPNESTEMATGTPLQENWSHTSPWHQTPNSSRSPPTTKHWSWGPGELFPLLFPPSGTPSHPPSDTAPTSTFSNP